MPIDNSNCDPTSKVATIEHASRRPRDDVEGSPRSMGDSLEKARYAPRRIADYELREFLGRGGEGRVYRYWDTRRQRDVAIKFLLRADGRTETLLRGAREIAKLVHPNVLRVHDAEEVNGMSFVVSEYIEGVSLAEVKAVGCWRRVLNLALDLARGLDAIHELGIVHGDIKPANALLDVRRNIVKLIDFGLARRADAGCDAGLSTGANHAPPVPGGDSEHGEPCIQGTLRYMAPEIRRGERTSKRSDVYAFGVTLCELCVGENRRLGASHTRERSHSHVSARPDSVSPGAADALSAIPARLGATIRRCLAHKPEYRYESARPLLHALEALSVEDGFGDHCQWQTCTTIVGQPPVIQDIGCQPPSWRSVTPIPYHSFCTNVYVGSVDTRR